MLLNDTSYCVKLNSAVRPKSTQILGEVIAATVQQISPIIPSQYCFFIIAIIPDIKLSGTKMNPNMKIPSIPKIIDAIPAPDPVRLS